MDGKDIALIRVCDELQHFGFGPKNLRQYVIAANRESTTFEQALMVYARRAGGVEMELTDESREQFGKALTKMLLLTGQVREALIRKRIGNAFSEME